MVGKDFTAKTLGLFVIVLCFFLTAKPTYGEAMPRFSLGFRTGVTMAGSLDASFSLHEGIGSLSLPWFYQWDSGWLFTSEIEMTAGKLRAVQDNGFIASAGPAMAVIIPQGQISLVLGVRVAYLDDYGFGGENLGGRMSFVEELGVELKIYSGLRAGYRIRHMSNAGIYDNNPGVDMHVFEVRYRF